MATYLLGMDIIWLLWVIINPVTIIPNPCKSRHQNWQLILMPREVIFWREREFISRDGHQMYAIKYCQMQRCANISWRLTWSPSHQSPLSPIIESYRPIPTSLGNGKIYFAGVLLFVLIFGIGADEAVWRHHACETGWGPGSDRFQHFTEWLRTPLCYLCDIYLSPPLHKLANLVISPLLNIKRCGYIWRRDTKDQRLKIK